MKALFWDFDGTLVDSRLKNYQVTKKIITHSTNKDFNTIPFLKSFENYKKGIANFSNWREIYQKGINLSAEETDTIGRLWTEFQLGDDTRAPLFDGLSEVISKYGDLPNVIISQNSRRNILQILDDNNIASYFNLIIGFEEVDIRKQKPDPAGFFKCIEDLSLTHDHLIYFIGDHETDIVFANNASQVLKSMKSNTRILSIGAFYGNDQSVSDWRVQPDFVAKIPEDIIQIINNS
jgi:HAD superfamily hydrolase (TIGR01549 family)